MLTSQCIYTILHTRKLRESFESGRKGTYQENRIWATARQLLAEANQEGRKLPILFAPAEDDSMKLFAWAILTDVTIANQLTTYSFTDLALFHNRPEITTIKMVHNQQHLTKNHIRPYIRVFTPDYLDQ